MFKGHALSWLACRTVYPNSEARIPSEASHGGPASEEDHRSLGRSSVSVALQLRPSGRGAVTPKTSSARALRPDMVNRANHFDTLRCGAATAVLVSHAFAIVALPQPLRLLSKGQTDLGTIAVLIFFVISGYLITQSYDRSPRPWRYLSARALRIFPALFVAVFLTAVVLGPMVTSLPVSEYFNHLDTALYIPRNMSLVFNQWTLPGVFSNNPVPNAVNNSLWTLQYEFVMYLVILLLGLTRLLNRFVVVGLWLGAAALTSAHHGAYYTYFAVPFLSGAVLFFWRDVVPWDWRLAALSVLPLAATLLWGEFTLAFVTFGAYLVIFLAFAPVRIPNLARFGDLSYGIYVFAFPVEQAVAHFDRSITWYREIAISLPIVLLLSLLSWHLIERRALSLRQALRLHNATT